MARSKPGAGGRGAGGSKAAGGAGGKAAGKAAGRAGRETDPAALRAALLRRAGRRSSASAKLTLPAVPSMIEPYVAVLGAALSALGRPMGAAKEAELRAQLGRAVEASWRVSPHGSIVVRLDADASGLGTFSAAVHASPSSIEAQYDEWVATREPPFFGTFPDAMLTRVAATLGEPGASPVLDVGAGTGRNALALAREGFPVDIIEPTPAFAQAVLAGAADEGLPVRRLEVDFLAPALGPDARPLSPRYRLVLLSEVTSHFRSPADLRRLFERAAEGLLPGGYLLFNVFLSVDGYSPDRAARELSQAFWSTVFTSAELAQASAGLPFSLAAREPVAAFEQANLPDEAWPPRTWYPEWVSGQDLFDLPAERCPMEMSWLLYRRG
jgi:SAM-dependent methyltransferase